MTWDKNYRPLREGEIIRPGDEVMTEDEWLPAMHTIGQKAPDPSYTSHRVYRRRLMSLNRPDKPIRNDGTTSFADRHPILAAAAIGGFVILAGLSIMVTWRLGQKIEAQNGNVPTQERR